MRLICGATAKTLILMIGPPRFKDLIRARRSGLIRGLEVLPMAKGTKVTLDKKDCRASDLKAGTKIRVTTKKSDETALICIEAIEKDGDFAKQI